jgi:hypothetical protein
MNTIFDPRQRKLSIFILIAAITFLSFLGIQTAIGWSQSAGKPITWVAPSLVRIGKTDRPNNQKNISLYAARGEYESFQIIVTAPPSELKNVNIVVSDLRSPSGKVIPKQQITLYREHYVQVRQPSTIYGGQTNPSLGAGWYPDGLIPFVHPQTKAALQGASLQAVPFKVSPSNNQPIWVDIFVPRKTKAGKYQGKFTVTSNQGNNEGQISLTVGKFALPLKPTLNSSFAFWEAKSKTNNIELLQHKLMPKEVDPADERSLISKWGLTSTDLTFWSGANYSSCKMDAAPTIQNIKNKAAQHQKDLLLYNFSADEIDACQNLEAIMKQWAANLHQAGVKNLVTMKPLPSFYQNLAKSVVDIWVLSPGMYEQSISRVAEVIKKGHQVWSYNTLVQDNYAPHWGIDFAPINYRIQPGFINQSLGLNGLLYWRIDLWTKDPWHDIQTYKDKNSSYPGEGMLVYPGAAVGVDGVVPSMRLKWLRDGVEDYEYVEILKKQGRGSWALNVGKTVGAGWKKWTRDPNTLESARLKLGQEIDRVSSMQQARK